MQENMNQSVIEAKGHIRCLMAVPANIEALLKELEAESNEN